MKNLLVLATESMQPGDTFSCCKNEARLPACKTNIDFSNIALDF